MVNPKFDDKELKKRLTKTQYEVLVNKGTEPPFSGTLLNNNEKGTYKCAVCGSELFSSDHKFESKTPGLVGWPSFNDVINNKAIELSEDNRYGMNRIEVTCANCGSHLGHLFHLSNDHSSDKDYCINSAALDFKPESNKG